MLKFISESQEQLTKVGKHLVGILAFFRRSARGSKRAHGYHQDGQGHDNFSENLDITSYSKKKSKAPQPSVRIAAVNVKHFHALVAMQKGLDTRSKIIEGNHVSRLQTQAANQDTQPHDLMMH